LSTFADEEGLMRKVFVRFFVVLGAVLVVVLGLVQTATADEGEELPPAPEAHNRWTNGCSSPFGNAPGGNDFTEACNWHDLCYGGYIDGYGKPGCDATFHQYMDTICYYNHGNSSGCRAWSAAYYWGVSWFGGWYYDPFFP
jgi:hypothetical protein